MLCRLPNSLPMTCCCDSPASSRSSNGSNAAKMTPALLALVKVAPEKPAKATAFVTPGVDLDDLRRPLDHRVGARQRGAVGQLDDDDRIALVERRDEAARHALRHVDGREDQAGEDHQHATQRDPRSDQEPHDAGIALRQPVEAVVEAVGQRAAEARQEEARRRGRAVMRLEQQRGERRRQRQRIERRDRRRHRDGDGELQIELARNAGNEGGRHEHRDQHQRDRRSPRCRPRPWCGAPPRSATCRWRCCARHSRPRRSRRRRRCRSPAPGRTGSAC